MKKFEIEYINNPRVEATLKALAHPEQVAYLQALADGPPESYGMKVAERLRDRCKFVLRQLELNKRT